MIRKLFLFFVLFFSVLAVAQDPYKASQVVVYTGTWANDPALVLKVSFPDRIEEGDQLRPRLFTLNDAEIRYRGSSTGNSYKFEGTTTVNSKKITVVLVLTIKNNHIDKVAAMINNKDLQDLSIVVSPRVTNS